MIYEIFNAIDGKPHGFRFGDNRLNETMSRLDSVNIPGFCYDYLPAKEGFYVLDMRESVKAGPFVSYREAQDKCDAENMANDHNSFRVFAQTL